MESPTTSILKFALVMLISIGAYLLSPIIMSIYFIALVNFKSIYEGVFKSIIKEAEEEIRSDKDLKGNLSEEEWTRISDILKNNMNITVCANVKLKLCT